MLKRTWFLVCCLALLTDGCAYSYVDGDGTRHIIGLVSIEIKPTDDNETLAGNIVDVKSVGVAFQSIPNNTSFTIGYSRTVAAAFRNHSLVLGNPLAALEANGSIAAKEVGAIDE